jgi:type I restriction enzyme R subunit
MPLGQSDTRAKRIDPVLHGRGWTEDLIRLPHSPPSVPAPCDS